MYAKRESIDIESGRISNDLNVLLRLPGVGTYRARVILRFAVGVPVPMVDEGVRGS